MEYLQLKSRACELYQGFSRWEEDRDRELRPKLSDFIATTDAYGEFLCHLVLIIGQTPPVGVPDSVIRDLAADVFDALYDARSLILRNRCLTAYPLSRRAFESLSLLTLCRHDSSIAVRWERGDKIRNSLVREELTKHPLRDLKPILQQSYSLFEATHPNRRIVGRRSLGIDSEFTLGAGAELPDALVFLHCAQLMSLWHWFAPAMLTHYFDVIMDTDQEFGASYPKLAPRAVGVVEDLLERLPKPPDESRSLSSKSNRKK